MEAKGKKYLKSVGILMIVFGALGALINGLGLLGGGILAVAGTADGIAGAAISGGVIIAMCVFGFLWSVVELATGIVGVKNCENKEKAATCFKFGAVILICAIISGLWGIWTQGINVSTIVSLLVGIVLPGLFCHGAKLNQQ